MTESPRLGLAEAIERLDAMPEFLDTALEVAAPGHLRDHVVPDAFSMIEHACHLRDLEREGYLVRLRRMLSEKSPALEEFDGAAIASQRDYPSQDPLMAAQEFAAARGELVGMLAPLTEEDLDRAGTFAGRPVSLGDLVAMMVEHDRTHREEIERLIDAIGD